MPGPVGKRDSERRRRNKPTTETIRVDLSETLAQSVEIPAPPIRERDHYDADGDLVAEAGEQEWHPIAIEWYLSLTKSGQAIFYEASDWALAYLLASQISLAYEPRPTQIGVDEEGKPIFRTMVMPMNGAMITSILKGASSLMSTEGDRRRLKIELDRQKQREAAGVDGDKVVSIAAKRADVFASSTKRHSQPS